MDFEAIPLAARAQCHVWRVAAWISSRQRRERSRSRIDRVASAPTAAVATNGRGSEEHGRSAASLPAGRRSSVPVDTMGLRRSPLGSHQGNGKNGLVVRSVASSRHRLWPWRPTAAAARSMVAAQHRCQPTAGAPCVSTPRGFEPLRAEPNGFRVHPLGRSGTVSGDVAADLPVMHS